MSPRSLALVLPFDPQEQSSHDQAIAEASALCEASRAAVLDVLQLVPAAGAVPPRGNHPRLRWWEIIHPGAAAADSPGVIASLAEQALRTEALHLAGPRLVLIPAAPLAEEAAALLASAFDGATLGRCSRVGLAGADAQGTRAVFGGRLEVQVRSDAALCCATWRPQPCSPSLHPVPADAVKTLRIEATLPSAWDAEVLPSADEQARLQGARLVVSGGRGVGGPEGFELLGRLASMLGGALGGSLPAVDAGWVPVARQVGVSGKFVTPRVYFAVGISGTPQHLWGVSTTSRIIAVNKDPEAPIFKVADVGVVADWRELLPLVAQALE